MRRRSRLTTKTEKRTQKSIILAILGIIIVLFLLIKFGVNILVGFSMFLAGTKNQNAINPNSLKQDYMPAPILNPLQSATNSAEITISGKSQAKQTVKLYINNNLKDTTKTDDNGTFYFNETLSQGENIIETKSEQNNKSSDFSNRLTVTFKNSAPLLTVDSPSDGQTYSKDQNSVLVTGKTDSNITVTVNGFWAIINEDNAYSYSLPLQSGDNQIKIIATDNAGNKTEKNLKVNYSQ